MTASLRILSLALFGAYVASLLVIAYVIAVFGVDALSVHIQTEKQYFHFLIRALKALSFLLATFLLPGLLALAYGYVYLRRLIHGRTERCMAAELVTILVSALTFAFYAAIAYGDSL